MNNDNQLAENSEQEVSQNLGLKEANPNNPTTTEAAPNTIQPEMNSTMTTAGVSNPAQPPNQEIEKAKGHAWIPLIIILVLLVGGCIGAYFLVFANPKQAFQKTIDKSFNYLTSSIKKLDNQSSSFKGEMSLDYNITSNDTELQKLMEVLNHVDWNFQYGMDYNNKVFTFDLDTKYKNENLINANIYGKDGKVYILAKDVMNKYLYTEVEEYDKFFKREDIHTEDYTTVLNSVKTALKKALKNEKFKKTEETLTIQGKSEKVSKNSLVLDATATANISKSLLKSLKEDKKFIQIFSKISEVTEKELTDNLEESYNQIQVDETDKTVLTVSIYTSGLLHSFVGFEIDLKYEEQPLYKILITQKNNFYEFNIFSGEEKILTGSLKEEAKDSTFKEELTLDIASTVSVKLLLNGKMEYNTKIEEPNLSNSVNYEELTETELNDIITKLSKNKAFTDFLNDIQSYSDELNSISFRSRY